MLPAPPPGFFAKFLGREEIDVQLMVPAGEQVPSAWTAELVDPLVRRVGFTTVEAATKWLDTREFSIVTESENGWSCGTAHFFDVYQQLEDRSSQR